MADRALNIVTTFRGCRKTKTADRMAFRSTFLWPLFPRYWRRRYIHIKNVTQYQAQFSSESARALERYKERLWAYGLRACSAAVLTFLTTGLVVPASTDSTLRTLSLLSGVPSFDESLGLATFFVFFFAFVKRQRVYIVDDALRYGAPHGHKRHNLQLMLDDIKCYGCAHAVILLSSNEGVHRLFSDKNETTVVRHSFPSAASDEFLLAVQKSMVSLSPIAQYRGIKEHAPPLTAAAVESMQACYGMHHHAASVRWWVTVHHHLGGSRQALLEVCHGVRTLAADRVLLQTIAIELDLQAEPAGRTFAFAYSPCVPIAASLRGYFSPEEIVHIVATLQRSDFPRRLLLAAALVATDPSTPRDCDPHDTVTIIDGVPTPPPNPYHFLHLVWDAIKPLPNAGEDVFAEDLHCASAMHTIRTLVYSKLWQRNQG